MKNIKILLFIFFLIFIVGCVKNREMNKEQIKKIVNQNLKPGDSEKKIINFLESQGWLYGYDEFQQRFQIDVPNSREEIFIFKKGIQVYIYVNNNKSFNRVETEFVTQGL